MKTSKTVITQEEIPELMGKYLKAINYKKKIKDEGERTLKQLREENPNTSESDIQELYADTAWGNPFDDEDYGATGKVIL